MLLPVAQRLGSASGNEYVQLVLVVTPGEMHPLVGQRRDESKRPVLARDDGHEPDVRAVGRGEEERERVSGFVGGRTLEVIGGEPQRGVRVARLVRDLRDDVVLR